jgi:hypothetical protein
MNEGPVMPFAAAWLLNRSAYGILLGCLFFLCGFTPAVAATSPSGAESLNRAGFAGGSTIWKDGAMGTKKPSKPCPAELRERAVRLVREPEGERASQAAAIRSIAEKVGCSRETLRSIAARSTGAPGRARSRAVRRPGHR